MYRRLRERKIIKNHRRHLLQNITEKPDFRNFPTGFTLTWRPKLREDSGSIPLIAHRQGMTTPGERGHFHHSDRQYKTGDTLNSEPAATSQRGLVVLDAFESIQN